MQTSDQKCEKCNELFQQGLTVDNDSTALMGWTIAVLEHKQQTCHDVYAALRELGTSNG